MSLMNIVLAQIPRPSPGKHWAKSRPISLLETGGLHWRPNNHVVGAHFVARTICNHHSFSPKPKQKKGECGWLLPTTRGPWSHGRGESIAGVGDGVPRRNK